jgi:hypothetical protein
MRGVSVKPAYLLQARCQLRAAWRKSLIRKGARAANRRAGRRRMGDAALKPALSVASL